MGKYWSSIPDNTTQNLVKAHFSWFTSNVNQLVEAPRLHKPARNFASILILTPIAHTLLFMLLWTEQCLQFTQMNTKKQQYWDIWCLVLIISYCFCPWPLPVSKYNIASEVWTASYTSYHVSFSIFVKVTISELLSVLNAQSESKFLYPEAHIISCSNFCKGLDFTPR